MTNETKFTPEMLEVVRKATILAFHEGKSYEEGLEEERVKGCLFSPKSKMEVLRYTTIDKGDVIELIHEDTKYEHEFVIQGFRGTVELKHSVFKQLDNFGLPLTFSRIMVMLEKAPDHRGGLLKPYYKNNLISTEACGNKSLQSICYWKLTNPNGSDRNFEDQAEETKLAIYEIA